MTKHLFEDFYLRAWKFLEFSLILQQFKMK
jgi:hypothetical protein